MTGLKSVSCMGFHTIYIRCYVLKYAALVGFKVTTLNEVSTNHQAFASNSIQSLTELESIPCMSFHEVI